MNILSLLSIDSMAPVTFFLVDFDLMLEDSENSFRRYELMSSGLFVGGTYREISCVPRPRYPFNSSRSSFRLYRSLAVNFLIFAISYHREAYHAAIRYHSQSKNFIHFRMAPGSALPSHLEIHVLRFY